MLFLILAGLALVAAVRHTLVSQSSLSNCSEARSWADVEHRNHSRTIFHSLQAKLHFPNRLLQQERSLPAIELEKLCVADTVGGATLAADASFQLQAQRGLRAAASKGILFSGLLRNIGTSGPRLLSSLRMVGDAFARYHIVLLENDSWDETRRELEGECKSTDVWCFELSIPRMEKHNQGQGQIDRVRNLVTLRQGLLEKVRQFVSLSPSPEKYSWDFLMFVDGDMFSKGSEGFHPSMVAALLGFPAAGSASRDHNPFHAPESSAVLAEEPWDGVCANQLANSPQPGRYRDTFALRTTNWYNNKNYWQTQLYYSGNKLVPVKSCFSGLALYSMKALQTSGCNYSYEDKDTCEHATFNRCLADHGFDKFAIFPPLTNMVNDNGVSGVSCRSFSSK